MNRIVLGISPTCTAFDRITVGSKVTGDLNDFKSGLELAIDGSDRLNNFSSTGQAFIHLNEDLRKMVRCGVARMSDVVVFSSLDKATEEENQILHMNTHAKMWRGQVQLFAMPACAAKTEMAAAVVYTREAYNKDPDVVASGKVQPDYVTHVLVAIIATAGPKAPYPPMTLIHNIAGGNQSFIPKSNVSAGGLQFGPRSEGNPSYSPAFDDCFLLHRIIGFAKETEEYAKNWMVVADI